MTDRPSGYRHLADTPPFLLGFGAAVGVGLAYLIFRTLVDARTMLVLMGSALFFAVGLDPAVHAVERWGMRRSFAVVVVFLALAAVATGFGFAVVPPLVDQVTSFVHKVPGYLSDLERNRRIASLDHRWHFIQKAQNYFQSGALVKTLAGHVLSAGTALASTVFDGVTVLTLTLYFLAYLDNITSSAYRLIPRSRRDRAQEVGGKITKQLGEYVAGNLVVALIAGLVALVWFTSIGAQFPIALAFVVAILDVLPLIGATAAILIVSVIEFISSTPAGIATVVFFVLYQVFENHFLVPRLFPTRVRINPVATIVGALVGAAFLGFFGFLLAIPLVATADLVVREVLIPRQRSR